MLFLTAVLVVGVVLAGDFTHAAVPLRFSRSVSLKLLNAEDAAIVLRTAQPGIDYPILQSPPKTSFSCSWPDIVSGVRYADAETGCQVFHICDDAKVDTTYMCPNETIFNDESQVCEWFHQVDCKLAYKRPIEATLLVVAPSVVQKPEVVATIIPVTEEVVKPICTTTCTNNNQQVQQVAAVAAAPAQTPVVILNTVKEQVYERRPLAPVVVVSSIPIRPSTDDKVTNTYNKPSYTQSVSSNAIQAAPVKATSVIAIPTAIVSSQQAVPAQATQSGNLGTGILSNRQSGGSGWGATIQPKLAVAAPVSSGWGAHTQQLAAPVSAGWGSQQGGQQSMMGGGGFGASMNPGYAGAGSFFSPFAAYGSGIMNTFIRPFLNFPFMG